jgi:hypothetical protein
MDVRDELARVTGLGYKVFPIVRKAKKPLTSNGLDDATTDMVQVDKWIKIHGDCNWAIAVPPDAVVVDIDTLDGGDPNLWPRDQDKAASLMDCGAISTTPRKGRHHWFRQPVRGKWRNTAGKLAPKVDTRAEGGYVLIAPSSTRDGEYGWIPGWELDKPPEDLPYPPAWLITCLNENPGRGPVHVDKTGAATLPPAECVLTYNQSTEVFVNTHAFWHDFAISVLMENGGQYSHTIDDVVYFTRPGRDPRDSYSAKWNHPAARHGARIIDGLRLGFPRLTVFTGNWPPFEAEQSYSAYDVIRLLTRDKDEWTKIRNHMATDHAKYWQSIDPEYGGEIEAVEELEPKVPDLVNPADNLPNSFPSTFIEAVSSHKNGIIHRVSEAIRKAEWMQQPLFRYSGALALMSTITGRKVVTKCGLLPNCYFLNVAPTGEGKDTARKVISRILDETEPAQSTLPDDVDGESKDGYALVSARRGVINLPHSDTATLRALEENPNRLAMVDELGAILATAKKSPTSLLHRQLILLTGIFTHGRGIYQPPRYADSTKNFEVDTPCLSLFGFTVERSLGEAIDSAAVEGGLIPRCLMFRGLDEAPSCNGTSGPLDDQLLKDIRRWREWVPEPEKGKRMSADPFITWDISPEADAIFDNARAEWLKQKRHGQSSGETEYLVYTRALELAKKLAIVISADRIGPPPIHPNSSAWLPCISEDDARAACDMVDFCMEEMGRFVKCQTADGPIARAANLIYSFMERNKGREINRTQLTRGVRQVESKELRAKAIDILKDQGRIKDGKNGGWTLV